jgi:hypothetical protein
MLHNPQHYPTAGGVSSFKAQFEHYKNLKSTTCFCGDSISDDELAIRSLCQQMFDGWTEVEMLLLLLSLMMVVSLGSMVRTWLKASCFELSIPKIIQQEAIVKRNKTPNPV